MIWENIKEAIRSYDKALARQPNNPDLLINKGNAFVSRSKIILAL